MEPHRGALFRFSNHTGGAVRSAFFFLGNRMYGAVRYGAVRFSLFQNHTVRCGAVFLLNGAKRCGLYF